MDIHDRMLEVKEIYKAYKKENVVSNVTFSVFEGDIVGYVGPNGAGKSTTLKMICNITRADKGQIILQEGKKIGVIFDDNGLYPDMTVYENILFFAKLYNVGAKNQQIDEMLKFVGLYEKKNCVVKNFSKGMLRKVVIARLLICNPDLLIMDEPFDGLDVESQSSIIGFLSEWVKENKKGIIITSHNLKELQNFCSKIIFLNEGRIVLQGNISDILNGYFKYLRIRLYDTQQISQVVKLLCENNFKYDISGDNIHVFVEQPQCIDIIGSLTKQNILFREIVEETMNLEEIYLKEVVNSEKKCY